MTKTQKIAAATQDAYSRNRYTDAAWTRIAGLLLTQGFNPEEAAWVLNSKHMRWAADAANRSHSATANDFVAYASGLVTNDHGRKTGFASLLIEARKDLTPKPLATTGADLAGACEGEDVAELIDFVRKVRSTGRVADAAALVEEAGRILDRIEARAKA